MSDNGLKILYNNIFGRFVLKRLINPKLSIKIGKYLDSPKSIKRIKGFIIDNDIDISEYEDADYTSFNDFFCRKIKPECRPISMFGTDFISPCDGLLSAYKIDDGLIMPIKQSSYSVSSLLKNEEIAQYYKDGYALVFRLCVNNYHRYHYIDDCIKSKNFHIDGVLHTVRPIALEKARVFCENTREYTIMKTKNFGAITQIEVGALLVGKIDNYHEEGEHKRGEEKGRFLYGGSTIVLLIEKDTVDLPQEYFISTSNGEEIPVKLGEILGKSRL